MAVCFDPVLGEMRLRDEPDGPPLSIKLDGKVMEPNADGVVDIPSATTTRKGVVKLSNSTDSTSTADAATPYAVYSVKNLAAKVNDDNSFYGSNTFYGGNTFTSIPMVESAGRSSLVMPDLQYTGAMLSVSGSFTEYNESTGEWDSIYEIFSGAAVKKILGANSYDGYDACSELNNYGYADIYGVPPIISLWGSWEIPLVEEIYDESNDVYIPELREYANLAYAHVMLIEKDQYGPDGQSDWFSYSGVVELVGMDWETYYGGVPFSVKWKISGQFILASAYFDWSYFYPYEGYEHLHVDMMNDFWTSLWEFMSSTDHNSPYFAWEYMEYPDEYGWKPYVNSAIATLDDLPNVESAVSTHNSDPSAHSNISLAASRITSGTFNAARIPNLDAGKINSGTFNAARIPSLDAGKIASGTFGVDRIPSLAASKISSGTFDVSRIPVLPSNKIDGFSEALTLTPVYSQTPTYGPNWVLKALPYPGESEVIPSDLIIHSVSWYNSKWFIKVQRSTTIRYDVTVEGTSSDAVIDCSGTHSVIGAYKFRVTKERTDIVGYYLGNQTDKILKAVDTASV